MLPDKMCRRPAKGRAETESFNRKFEIRASKISASRGLSFRVDRPGDTLCPAGIRRDAYLALSLHIPAVYGSLVPPFLSLGCNRPGALVEAASVHPSREHEVHSPSRHPSQHLRKCSGGDDMGRLQSAGAPGVPRVDLWPQ